MNAIWDNIRKMYLFKALRGSLILMPVVVLFFQDLWLSMKQVFFLQSIFAWAVVLLEVPTGYFGDMLRRKDGLIIGACCWLIGRTWYHLADWFRWIALADIFLALAYTFYSWSDAALLFDTLTETWRIGEFKKVKWRYLAMGNFAEWIGALLGWWLVVYWFWLITSVQIVLAAIGLIIACTLIEPKREKYELKEASIFHVLHVVKDALRWCPLISSIVLYSSVTSVSTMFRVRLAQPYFSEVWLPLLRFWILWAIGNISVWLFSLMTHRLEWIVSDKTLLILFPVFIIIAYLLLWTFPSLFILVVGFIFYGVRGISTVIYMDILNKETNSKERATVLSVRSLGFRLLFMILGPVVWGVVDGYWILMWMYSAAAISAIVCIIGLFFLRKNLSKI